MRIARSMKENELRGVYSIGLKCQITEYKRWSLAIEELMTYELHNGAELKSSQLLTYCKAP